MVGSFDYLKSDVFVPQVFMFVQNLIGCEEQACLFKEEVRPPFMLYTYPNVDGPIQYLLSGSNSLLPFC